MKAFQIWNGNETCFCSATDRLGKSFLNQMHHVFRFRFEDLFLFFSRVVHNIQRPPSLCNVFHTFRWEEERQIESNDFNSQPIIISKSRLNKFFNLSELPNEIGGLQSYNHDEWLRNRVVSSSAH